MTVKKPENVSIRERVKKPPSAALREAYFGPALTRALAHHFSTETWIHLAHAEMLHRQKIIGRDDYGRIAGALLEMHAAGSSALATDGTLEDLYSYVERHLTQVLGRETGGRLHTGRSRNDLHVTTWRMTLRELSLDVLLALAALRRAVLEMATQHAATVMPGYTHWQHAQPVTFGYYLLAFADLLARDFSRVLAAWHRTNLSPLGAGALTTTAFPLDREFCAAALGFSGLVEVAYDAVSNRDDAHESVAAFAIVMTNLSRIAVDLQAWSTFEYRYIELGDEHCSVSSIMPQKKNPAALENIKGLAAMVTGHLTAALASSKNTALADVSDGVTALNDPVTDAAVTTRRALTLMAEVLRALTVFPERMKEYAATGYGTATELADVIVRESGVSFRMAHNIVAVVVAEGIGAGKPATAITAEDISRAATHLFGEKLAISADAVRAALDPEENVRRRIVTGGPAPENMRDMLGRRGADLTKDEQRIDRLATGLRTAREAVFQRAAQKEERI